MEQKFYNRPTVRVAATILSIVTTVGTLAGCSGGTDERYSCAGNGQIKVEIVNTSTIPRKVISVSFHNDPEQFCADGKIDEDEQAALDSLASA